MTNDEKILEILMQMQSDISDLKTGQAKLEQDVADLKAGQEQLSHNVVSLENELVPKVTALFDGYTLRGEQIDNLKAHFDERFDDFQEDVSYLISKTGKQEKQIVSMSRQVKQILP